jgi:hypothetical protein
MLLTNDSLEAIARGEVDLVYRRWTRPTVRTGGTLRTRLGMLDIIAVDRVSMRSITAADARRAGYTTRVDLVRDLRRRPEGDVYRIELRTGGEDPLIALRSNPELDAEALSAIRTRLDRLDAASPTGSWTRRYLDLVESNPHVRAEDLAATIGVDKPAFKAKVRKLKALGLTISHSPGYEISSRGRAFLARDRT